MGIIGAGMVVVGCLLISRTKNCAEKLRIILFNIFLNGVC
jgi:hypothetical protein